MMKGQGFEQVNFYDSRKVKLLKNTPILILRITVFLLVYLTICVISTGCSSPPTQEESADAPAAPSQNATETPELPATNTPKPTDTETPIPTPTDTPLPTLTPTITPSPTPEPIGGGGLIAFSSIRVGSRFSSPKSDIVVLNPNNGEQSRLTESETAAVREYPSWSPLGDRLVYTMDNHIFLIGTDGSSEVELSSPFGSGVYHPTWSSNDEVLAIYLPEGKYPQFWHSPAENPEWEPITPEFPFQFDPVWSPDGQSYAFSGAQGTVISEWLDLVFYGFRLTYYDIKPRDIFAIDVQTGEMRQLTNQPEDEFQPAWSPDGQKLAFVSIQEENNPEIFIADLESDNTTRLTRSRGQDIFPSFSPDGSKIAFASDRDGNFEIYIMDVDGRNQVRMTDNILNDLQPVWSAASIDPSGLLSDSSNARVDLQEFVPERQNMEEVIQTLHREGLISTDEGKLSRLDDYSYAEAKINYFIYHFTGESPSNFVIRADARWESASDKANWWDSGCGIVFREKDNKDLYAAYLGMDGLARIAKWKNSFYSLVGVSTTRYPLEIPADNANFMLAVEDNNIMVFINGLLMLTQQDSSLKEGELAFTTVSGTNKGFGTRCEMVNIDLWELPD